MTPEERLDPSMLNADGEITLTVQVSIPVTMAYDEPPTLADLRAAAVENFLDHVAQCNDEDLTGCIDSIGNGELDLTQETAIGVGDGMTCLACEGKRYLISLRSDGRTAVEICDSCQNRNIFSDVDAAVWAQQDGIACESTYPCYLKGEA